MKRSIFLAFATLTLSFLAMAQSPESPIPAPASGETKPLPTGEPAPVPGTPPVPVPPAVPPVPDVTSGAVPPVPAPPEKPGRPEFKRRSPPGAEEKSGKSVRVPFPPALEDDPKSRAEPAAPAQGMKTPSARPAETDGSATPPAVSGIRPGTRPGSRKKSTEPNGRPHDPARTPARSSGTPMPAATPAPEVQVETKTAERPERPVPQKRPSKETAKELEDMGKRDRKADAVQARKIEGKDDAKSLIMNILGAVAGGQVATPSRPADRSRKGYRPSVEEVGRTQMDRDRNIGMMVNRFGGQAPQSAPPGVDPRDRRNPAFTQGQRAPQFYEGNRRVVRYASVQEIPPVLIAFQQLNRVQVLPQAQSPYNVRPQAPQQGRYDNDIPPSYTTGNAYALSYSVDPNSAISRDDILFRQGSTDFADAYSYDLVIDVAEAMNAPTLRNETFVIEGHASAEGDYGSNLLLSQERAERISRELVRHGVSPERLMPVGYGEAEAAYPANARESDRSLDRRVVVFRMR